ncbi:MAG: zinc ribbon domain-containing protein [Anaerolineales bacterium]|nr:zinc ribbon domain-containing protein [Anaerolineales bacterium]
MEKRAYHGNITPQDIGRAIVAEFDQGNMQAQMIGGDERIIVQVASRTFRESGGHTAMTVILEKIEDGVMVQLGDQQWFGVAASMGQTALTALSALRNPLRMLGRLDDLAQDITSIQLTESVWRTIQRTAEAAGAGYQISERLRRTECAYCGVAAPVGEPTCPACGGPMGAAQPKACLKCGFVPPAGTRQCPKCGAKMTG